MRFLFLFFLAGFALASATYVQNNQGYKTADKEFLYKQKKILDLLNHVTQRNTHQDQVQIGRDYSIEANVHKYTKVEVVKDFVDCLKRGLLPKHKIFSLTFDRHRDEAIALFHLFYYAKDFETFYKTCCWARERVNDGMFVYALTVAVLHRVDCKGIILPPPYEIYPFYFVTGDVIHTANRIKNQGYIQNKKIAERNGVYQLDNNVYTITTNYSVGYDFNDEEMKIRYFTTDIGLNTYYYYFHVDYPFWMGGEQYGLYKDRRGELHYYIYQQILARYYLERLCNGLGEIDRFDLRWPIKKGYNPNILHHNGYPMPARTDMYNVEIDYNIYLIQEVEDYERRIRDCIDRGYVVLYDGTKLNLKTVTDIEVLGNFIQGNPDLGDLKFYDYLTVIYKFLLGSGINTYDPENYVPSALEQFQTAMRDPMFYQLYQRIVRYFLRFKERLPIYTRTELEFKGVKIEDVKTSPLTTYFETFDFDITNGVYQSKEELDTHKEKIKFFARQKRLNHKPFEVTIDLLSDKETDCSIRIFLGPKFDSMGRYIKFDDNRINFVELDFFVTKLVSGKNVIVRKNVDFARTVYDRTPMMVLYDKIEKSLVGNNDFRLDMTEAHNGWPLRLLLPRGKIGGMLYQLYVIVTPYRQAKTPYGTGFPKMYTAGVGTGGRYYEDLPFGYPLDRTIDEVEFWTPNMYLTDVKIYHSISFIKNKSTLRVDDDVVNWDLTDKVDVDTIDTLNVNKLDIENKYIHKHYDWDNTDRHY